MAIVDYPTWLGTVLMTKSRNQAATFSMSEPKSGPGYTKNTSVDVPVFWDVTFKFKASDAQRFQAWFVSTLNRGRNPFNMLLSTEFGNVSHVCQFMPDSLLPQSREANVHTYTAQIRSEAIKYPPYIEENIDFVASEFWPLRAEWDYALNVQWPY